MPLNTATTQELQWARAIKEAARKDSNLNDEDIVDLEYLHHAIVAKDNVEKALHRLRRMQKFKKRYGIQRDGSYEEGSRDYKAFIIAHPDFGLGMNSYFPKTTISDDETVRNNEDVDSNATGHDSTESTADEITVGCANYSKFLATKMKSEESHAIFMRGMFYMFQLCQSSISSMRGGIDLLCDCHGMGPRNFSLESEARQNELFSEAYPIRIRQIAMMNVNVVVRLFYRVALFFFSKKLRQTFVFTDNRDKFLHDKGLSASVLPIAWGGTLEEETAEKVFFQKMRARYDLAANFKLDLPGDDSRSESGQST